MSEDTGGLGRVVRNVAPKQQVNIKPHLQARLNAEHLSSGVRITRGADGKLSAVGAWHDVSPNRNLPLLKKAEVDQRNVMNADAQSIHWRADPPRVEGWYIVSSVGWGCDPQRMVYWDGSNWSLTTRVDSSAHAKLVAKQGFSMAPLLWLRPCSINEVPPVDLSGQILTLVASGYFALKDVAQA